MKKIWIFDFDGVLFRDPWEIHLEIFQDIDPRFMIIKEVILEKGKVPDHLYDIPLGQEYIKIFRDTYYAQRMSEHNIKRLRILSQDALLVIASRNTKETISKMLDLSQIDSLFETIYTTEDFSDKSEIFREIDNCYPEKELFFVTDTQYDINQVTSSGFDMNIFVVDRDLSEYNYIDFFIG